MCVLLKENNPLFENQFEGITEAAYSTSGNSFGSADAKSPGVFSIA